MKLTAILLGTNSRRVETHQLMAADIEVDLAEAGFTASKLAAG